MVFISLKDPIQIVKGQEFYWYPRKFYSIFQGKKEASLICTLLWSYRRPRSCSQKLLSSIHQKLNNDSTLRFTSLEDVFTKLIEEERPNEVFVHSSYARRKESYPLQVIFHHRQGWTYLIETFPFAWTNDLRVFTVCCAKSNVIRIHFWVNR